MSHVVLQPGMGSIAPGHYLPATPQTVLWGRLPCAADAAVFSIGSGDTVTIDTLSHEGLLEDQGRDPLAFFGGHGIAAGDVLADAVALAASNYPRDAEADGPHVVTGPIEVRGALPGDLLRMTLLEATPRVPYGVISSRHGRGALPGEYPVGPGTVSVFTEVDTDPDFGTEAGALFGTLPLVPGGDRVVRFPLDPFLGIMGVGVAGDARPHSVPPGAHGGNLDISLLTVGSALYLPVQVPGALAYVGDPHFAQGDGEVALTALEASLRVRIRFDVIPAVEAAALFGELTGPLAETGEFLVPTGLDPDLDEAMRACVRAAIALLGARYGMDPTLAYAYLSAATDFNISQVVDRVTGVHGRIRTADFGA
ncbi:MULTISPECIES: acetamidase/formamidase family protein [unclassified Cryobacterium]|uniref:acetamidase/formamidase family protein n=1 Tax=unclassified Cryobacterium TaxID=2649013 RepID=UPI001068DCAF|nr:MULTISPECIES: acetamidase/formamidase family protein [unclassified Cryobacterium]TFB95250.1 acetamidase [Cryobacterium sp. MDB2-A-1]TFC11285.1 acetamidase [Cryobacterium sp. MDB2-A-2]